MDTQEKSSKSTFLDRPLTKQFDLTVALIALAILLIILIVDKANFIRLWSSAFRPGFTRMLATTSPSHVEEVLAPEYRVLNLYLIMLASIAFHFAKQAFSPRRSRTTIRFKFSSIAIRCAAHSSESVSPCSLRRSID